MSVGGECKNGDVNYIIWGLLDFCLGFPFIDVFVMYVGFEFAFYETYFGCLLTKFIFYEMEGFLICFIFEFCRKIEWKLFFLCTNSELCRYFALRVLITIYTYVKKYTLM